MTWSAAALLQASDWGHAKIATTAAAPSGETTAAVARDRSMDPSSWFDKASMVVQGGDSILSGGGAKLSKPTRPPGEDGWNHRLTFVNKAG
jgi:hypothetical protein